MQAGKTGLLYSAGDVEQLESAIRFLSEQPEQAEKMGLEGRERVRQRFTPEAHYAALVSLYDRLVDGGWQSSDASRQGTIRKTAFAVSASQVEIRRGWRWVRSFAVPYLGPNFAAPRRHFSGPVPEADAAGRIHWRARCGVEVQRH